MVSQAASPRCARCRSARRDSRSLLCPTCRAAHRRARKAESQRARRAAARQDPDVECLLLDLRQVTARLGAYLHRQRVKSDSQGQPLPAVQQDAQVLVDKANTLAALVSDRGLKPQRQARQQ